MEQEQDQNRNDGNKNDTENKENITPERETTNVDENGTIEANESNFEFDTSIHYDEEAKHIYGIYASMMNSRNAIMNSAETSENQRKAFRFVYDSYKAMESVCICIY